MKKIISILSVVAIIVALSSCGGKKAKKEVLEDPQIDAKIGVELGHYWNMSAVAISPDGKFVASAAYDKSIIVWNYETKHQVWAYRPAASDEKAGNYVSLKYTPDGKQIIAGSGNYAVDIFDAVKGEKIKNIPINGYSGKNLALSSDGKFFAVGAKDDIVSIFNVASGSLSKTFEGHTSSIYELAFSPDGKTLGTASYDSTARIWNVETGEIIKKIEAGEEVVSIAFNDAGDKFAFSCDDLKQVQIWDLAKMKNINTLEEVDADQIIFKGEDLLMRVYSKFSLVNIETGEEIKSVENYDWDMAIQGNIIASVGSNGVTVTDFAAGTELAEFGQDTRFVSNIEVSPSGRFIVTANSHKSGSGGPDILSYPIDTAYNFSAYGTSGGDVSLFSFLGTQDIIFSEESLGDGYFYDLKAGKSKSKMEDKVTDPFCITSDGALLIAKDVNNTGMYAIFDAKTGDLKTELIKNTSHLYFCGITPDDKYYVLLTMDFCKVFELPSGKETKSYEREDMDDIVFLDMTTDGQYIVGQADMYDFKISNILTGENTFLAEKINPEDASLNKDKNTVAVACDDYTVKVYDIALNKLTQTLSTHQGMVKSVCYTPDGKYLLSSAQDNQMKIWDLTGKELLTIVGLEKLSDYEGETKDFVVFAPNGRYDGTEAGIEKFLFFEKDGKRLPASDYKDKCYTKNLLGRTLGQDFIQSETEAE